MSFRIKRKDYTESITNLADPDDLPIPYTWTMTIGVVYPDHPSRILLIAWCVRSAPAT